jgi:hypothetical protein
VGWAGREDGEGLNHAVEVVVCLVGGDADRGYVMSEGGEDDGNESRGEGHHRWLDEEEEFSDPAETGRLNLLVC